MIHGHQWLQNLTSVTAHYIDEEWNLISYVLQTTEVETDHRSASLAEMLTVALEEWGLMSKDPAMVTDNAANMVRAVEIMGLSHIGCFAHNQPRLASRSQTPKYCTPAWESEAHCEVLSS